MSYSKQNFRSGDTLYASQLNAMDDEIAALEAEVESTKNMVGSPLTASTAAGMTDQTKIYVYTGTETGYTAGHWYYYNGTAWTDGGVYNSVAVNTDTSLTVPGQAADSKAVGDAIDELDGDLSDVKSNLNQTKSTVAVAPKIVETTATGTSVDIADPQGYVIARFSDGHIQTKNFDSSEIANDIDEKLDANQGSENAGKILGIGSNGDVEPKAISLPTNTPSMALVDSTSELDVVDDDGYVIVRYADGHIMTKNFDSKDFPRPCEYMFSDGKLMLAYRYTETVDAVIKMDVGRANNLFDFYSFSTKPRNLKLWECRESDITQVWRSGTDMHSPFQFIAVNNPDGYRADSTDPSYTGGNHTMKVDEEAYTTASSRYVKYYADGLPVSSGYGTFYKFEIRWANNVQAYNCVKLDGTGRTSLIEYHDMVFDGIEFKEHVTLVPTEDIIMRLWSGFQLVAWASSVCDHVRFIDATNRNIFTTEDADIRSGNANPSGIVEWGSEHTIETTVDTERDLGKRQYYSGTQGAHMSAESHKGYFFIIYGQNVNMSADTSYDLYGTFRFYPTVNEEV